MEEIKAQLEALREKIHAEFSGYGASDRIRQFDAHLSTVEMVVECLYDEAERMEGYRA